MSKPEKPNITIPASFAENGIKADFDSNKIENGFDSVQPDILSGDNLNKFIDDTYKASNYALQLGDYVDEKADKTDLNAKVNKSGDTMTGNLNINNTLPAVGFHNSEFDRSQTGTQTSTTTIGFTRLRDKNNLDVSILSTSYSPAGNLYTRLAVTRDVNGETKVSGINVGVRANGDLYTEAPTPSTGDNSTKIATTAYCVNMATTTAPTTTSSASKTRPAWVVENYVNGTSWYRIWSDGWCEQGQCNHSAGGTGTVTVNLLKAYKDTNYTVTLSNGVTSSYASSIQTKTTTSFSGGYLDRRCDWYACGYIK